MTDTHSPGHESESTSPLAKILAIVGFIATAGLLIWLIVTAVKLAPGGFASLSNTAETINNYHPETAIVLTSEKAVVNSAESFKLNWTDMKQEGEHLFTYSCTPGVKIDVRSAEGKLIPLLCTDKLTLPATVHGITLSITSTESRFADVPVKITFTNPAVETPFISETKITVVNATIPVKETATTVTAPDTDRPVPAPSVTPKPKPTQVTPVTPRPQAPIITYVEPQSNPNGYVDLQVVTLGSGVLKNGVFTKTSSYDEDKRNAVQFMVKNIGTKTSGSWDFKTKASSDTVYASDSQYALKPQEYVIFTLEYDLGNTRDRHVDIKTTVDTKNDTNGDNDSSSWSVKVDN